MQLCVYHHCATNNTERSKAAELSLSLTNSCFVLCFKKWNPRWKQTWQTNGSHLHKMETQLFSVQANWDSDWPLWQEGCSCDYCTLTMHWQPHVKVFLERSCPLLLTNGYHRQELPEALRLASTIFIGNVWTKGNRYAFAHTKRHYKNRIYVPSVKHQSCNHQIHFTGWHPSCAFRVAM